MDVERVKAIPEKHRLSVHLTIRVSPHMKNWLVENHFSATAIFHEAIKEIGYHKEGPDYAGIEDDGKEFERLENMNQDDAGEVYYVKQRIHTRHGPRTKLIKQYRPKPPRGKGNIPAQRKRAKYRKKAKRTRR